MDSHTLTVLQYRELLSSLSSCACSAPGAERALAVRPSATADDTARRLTLTAEAMRLLEESPPELQQVTDTGPILETLNVEGAVLDAGRLLALRANQTAAAGVKASLRALAGRTPRLEEKYGPITLFPQWEEWLDRSFDSRGEMLDAASPGLREARREQTRARQAVTRRLEEFSRGESVAKVLQEDYITVRNGRFVLPARREYHRAFTGVVQDNSQSGQTVFVEPEFAVELNNRFTTAGSRVREEEQRVLAEMSQQAAGHREAMALNLSLLAHCDLMLAKARFTDLLGGVVPALDPAGSELVHVRHPLLALNPEIDCVPVDISLGDGTNTLVITGPNTGGKTAALKTLGLVTLMAQSGLPVPADGRSRLRVFGKVFADIGDEQDLTQSLSTFSAHVNIISRIMQEADGDTLVLLDELGAGTDPQEGSALGVAILESLQQKGASVVVTTHHNLLKEYAYRQEGARNASTMFDSETLTPTYQLVMGAPGRSHAMEIADRLGLDNGVVARAKEIMGSGAARVDELLGRLSREVAREAAMRQESEDIRHQLSEERTRLARRQEKVNEDAERIRDNARQKAARVLRDLERQGKGVLRSLKGQPLEKARNELGSELKRMRQTVAEKLPSPPRRRGSGDVGPDQEAEVVTLGIRGTVLEVAGEDAVLLAGDVRIKVPVADLSPASAPEGRAGVKRSVAAVTYQGTTQAPSELNLLGRTVEEALGEVDKVLDQAVMGPASTLRIVHGKGTGALKRAIGEALAGDPRVSSFAAGTLEEGGAGVTVVMLKD